MYCTGLIEKCENCQALCKYDSVWNKEARDFFVVPGHLLQIKELFLICSNTSCEGEEGSITECLPFTSETGEKSLE